MSDQKQQILNKVFKNNKPEGAEVSLEKPVPRAALEINKEYEQVCIYIGDKSVKAKGLVQEIEQLYKRVESLGGELSARQKLDQDAAVAVAKPVETVQDSGSPQPTAEATV